MNINHPNNSDNFSSFDPLYSLFIPSFFNNSNKISGKFNYKIT